MYQQQGDVLIIEVSKIPEGAKRITPTKCGLVLAEGEATGHAHAIIDVAEVEAYTLEEQFFLKVGAPVIVTHEEHKPITIEPGTWRVAIVREYDHFAEVMCHYDTVVHPATAIIALKEYKKTNNEEYVEQVKDELAEVVQHLKHLE